MRRPHTVIAAILLVQNAAVGMKYAVQLADLGDEVIQDTHRVVRPIGRLVHQRAVDWAGRCSTARACRGVPGQLGEARAPRLFVPWLLSKTEC